MKCSIAFFLSFFPFLSFFVASPVIVSPSSKYFLTEFLKVVLVHCNRAHWLLVHIPLYFLLLSTSVQLQASTFVFLRVFSQLGNLLWLPIFHSSRLEVNDLHTSWNPQLWTDWNWSISIPAPLAKYRDKSGMSNCLPWDPPEGLAAFISNGSWFDYLPFVGRHLFLIWLFSISIPVIT